MLEENKRIGLALSGGGFRATLFHLGVVRYFYEADLLKYVNLITSVSGGSVLAGHMALNWSRYTGDDKSFVSAANEVIELTKIDVRGRIIRRWICGILFVVPRLFKLTSFDTLLKNAYRSFYRGSKLGDIPTGAGYPEFHVLSTSLTTGGLCKFTNAGFVHFDRDGIERLISNSSLPVSIAVAASSAFPPLFPPIAITKKLLNVDVRDLPHTLYLSDGGIFDNLGLEELTRLTNERQRGENQLIMVSDAGGNFDWTIDNPYSGIVNRNVRAMDILMDRLSRLVPIASGDSRDDIAIIDIGGSLNLPLGNPILPDHVQRGVHNIRTDLDSFSDVEIESLIKHGYSEARQTLSKRGMPLTKVASAWEMISKSSGVTSKQLRIDDAKRRSFRLFAEDDPISYIFLGVIIALTSAMYDAVFRYIAAAEVLRSTSVIDLSILDRRNGMPVRNGIVIASCSNNRSLFNGSENPGEYEFRMICPHGQMIDLEVEAQGYLTYRQTLRATEKAQVQVQLEPKGGLF